jgi:hypothetical protein
MQKEKRKMLKFTGKTIEGERINFGFNDIRHIIKEDDFVILERPSEIIVKFSSIEVEKVEKEVSDSNFPLAVRLGFH